VIDGDAVAGFLLIAVYLWAAKVFGLWAWEVWSMKRKGYWLDKGFSGRGRYSPVWRHTGKELPDVRSRHVPM
jgi:hypothetical protein